MDEQASFEPRAVLVPRQRRGARFALLVPLAAFVVIAWAGANGPRPDLTAVASPVPTTIALPSLPAEAPYPTVAIGLTVQRLGELQIGRLSFDAVVAISGWYVPGAITDCPVLAAIYRDGALPYVRGDADELAFCVRSGTLYPSKPDLASERARGVVRTGVAVTVMVGVVMPIALEQVGSAATQVVVIGRFGKSSDGCRTGIGCSRELLVDHVAWTPGA